jgi:hypothetical protein
MGANVSSPSFCRGTTVRISLSPPASSTEMSVVGDTTAARCWRSLQMTCPDMDGAEPACESDNKHCGNHTTMNTRSFTCSPMTCAAHHTPAGCYKLITPTLIQSNKFQNCMYRTPPGPFRQHVKRTNWCHYATRH